MNIRKIESVILMTAILLIAACALSGCSKKEQSGADKNDGKVTIKAAVWDLAITTYNEQLVKEFEASHPNVKVEIIDIPSTDFTQKLSVMLNGGSDVDVFWIKDGDTTRGLFNRSQLADLSAPITFVMSVRSVSLSVCSHVS